MSVRSLNHLISKWKKSMVFDTEPRYVLPVWLHNSTSDSTNWHPPSVYQDAYRATTAIAVRKARLDEIKREMFTSEKLKVYLHATLLIQLITIDVGEWILNGLRIILQTYFEDNPRDKQILRHDSTKGQLKLQQHLKNVPEYIGKLHRFPLVESFIHLYC